ncbi:TPA: hypothetical protein DCQ44_00985 [Candidatus Taylorbacteria bacterium]|nr:hypothetical protein [Candidatus Taylorbacteria bacterium]
MNAKIIWSIVGVIVLIAVGGFVIYLYQCNDASCYYFNWQKIRAADSFQKCADLGFPVTESSPRQCRAGDKTFTEQVQAVSDLIHVTTPLPDVLVQSPFVVTGEARGPWYFEASFPVKVYDSNGKELGSVAAQAKGNWTTNDFVPFEASLTFSAPTTEKGTIVFQKDNPSGLPANDQSVSIPVFFSANASKL